jgi:hypothetical protein
MPPPPPTFGEVCNEFQQFRAIIGRTLQRARPSEAKRQLEFIARSLDENFATFTEAYPKAAAQIEQERAAVERKVRENEARFARVKAEHQRAVQAQKAAAAKASQAAPAAKAPPAVPPVDLALGPTLREELLDRYVPGRRHDGRSPASDLRPQTREVWEDWREGGETT